MVRDTIPIVKVSYLWLQHKIDDEVNQLYLQVQVWACVRDDPSNTSVLDTFIYETHPAPCV